VSGPSSAGVWFEMIEVRRGKTLAENEVIGLRIRATDGIVRLSTARGAPGRGKTSALTSQLLKVRCCDDRYNLCEQLPRNNLISYRLGGDTVQYYPAVHG